MKKKSSKLKKASKVKSNVKKRISHSKNPIAIPPYISKVTLFNLSNDDPEMESLLNGLYYTYYDVVKFMNYEIPFWAFKGMITRDIQDRKYSYDQEIKLKRLIKDMSFYSNNLIVEFPVMK